MGVSVLSSALGGGCVALAFPTLHIWPLVFLGPMFPLLGSHERSGWNHFFTGWLFMTCIYVFGFTWIVYTLRVFAYMSLSGAIMGLLVFAASQGLMGGLWLYIVGRTRKWTGLPYWVLAPLVYVPLEHFFPVLFAWQLGCPLIHARYAAQAADLGGAHVLTFIVVLCGGGLVDFIIGAKKGKTGWSHRIGLVVFLGLFLGCSVYGAIRIRKIARILETAKTENRTITLGVVQPNIGIYEKEQKESLKDQLQIMQDLSAEAHSKGAQIIIWPETALQFFLDHDEVLEEIRKIQIHDPEEKLIPEHFVFPSTPMITGGITRREKNDRVFYHNVALFLDRQGKISSMAVKNHLVPFGEHLPLEDRFPGLRKHFPHAGNMAPGEKATVMDVYGIKMGIAICYEDIIASFTRRLTLKGSHVIINLTNDSWFGDGREPYQHLYLAALRSIETGRSMVRATNTGVSALIDPTGRIVQKTPTFRKAVMVVEVDLLKGNTVFVRFGPWFVYACLILLFAASLGFGLKKKPETSER